MERTFYSDTPRQVLDTLDTDPDQGLTQGEGARRLAGYGENKLEKAKPRDSSARCWPSSGTP